jgi:hypothetical protein
MKRTRAFAWVLLIAFASALTGCSPYNKLALKSGSLDFLRQEKQVNVAYSYDGMSVGKFVREQDYVDKKVAEYNKKEPGRGDKWREAWVNDRAARFQPKFETLLNHHVAEKLKDLKFGADPGAKYTLLLKTTALEPGYNVAISRRPALVSAEAIFCETQNRNNTVAVVSIEKATGMDFWGVDFDTGYRIQEAYAKAGKELGILIGKNLK